MSKKWISVMGLMLMLVLLTSAISGCFPSTSAPDAPEATQNTVDNMVSASAPKLPEKLQQIDGVPQLKVYNTATKSIEEMDIESYVEGVLAGEMRNDWPMEALKAQAILARTFVLRFVGEKKSKYEGADVSTDIVEAQAYDAEAINERVKRAVDETRGIVMVSGGEFPFAWFHAHAGGQTEYAKPALEYKQDEPQYTTSVQSEDSDKAPTAVKGWTATFGADEVGKAAGVGKVTTISIGEKAESGRAINFVINGEKVSAPGLRLKLDSKKLKSTLISKVTLDGGKVTFEGKGYGHGVGMSQWGAYGMAEQGQKAEDIVRHYFKNITIEKMWN